MSEHVWAEKYRPRTVAECVLPGAVAAQFEGYVRSGHLPNLLLSGKPGCGKTSVAKAAVEELGADVLVINASLNGNIETLRVDILQFASTVSFGGGKKYVILDEADYLNAVSTQPALRNFIEEYSVNCGFILTCNYPQRVIEPLRSRLSHVVFDVTGDEKAAMQARIFQRLVGILEKEGVGYDPKAVAQLVAKYTPDWRKVINEAQGYASTGSIDTGVLSVLSDDEIRELVSAIKAKNFTDVRKWVARYASDDTHTLVRRLYDRADELVEPSSMAVFTIICRDALRDAAFVSDQEINNAAFATMLLLDVSFR